jgi:hypothetical protein
MQRFFTLAFLVLAALSSACDVGQQTSTNPAVGSYTPRRMLIDIGGGGITSEPGAAVNLSFFKAAKIAPLVGRFFAEADSSQSVAVLGEDFWRRSFGADPGVIGREFEIDQRRMIVVGIAPKSFQFPEGAQLWVLR